MIKKGVYFLVAVLFVPLAVLADWKSEIKAYFGVNNDFRGVINYLGERFETLEPSDKPAAAGLLAYSYSKLGDDDNSSRWLSEYLDTYGGFGEGFYFLDETTHTALRTFFSTWLRKYPLVREMLFIESRDVGDSSPPSFLVIGIVLANPAYYKLSDAKGVIKGGLFLRGFNSITLETGQLLEKPGSHLFTLELKAEDFILKKAITIDVHFEFPRPAADPIIIAKDREFELSVYAGEKLLASSKKTIPATPPLKVETPPGKGRYSPYGPIDPGEEWNPFANSASILDAVAGIYSLFKELKKKKEGEAAVPPLKKTDLLAFSVFRKNPQGVEQNVRARLTLRVKNVYSR